MVGSRVTWDQKKTNVGRGDFWACCPIHGENSPSFHVEDRKGRGHCFGCGWSGDVFTFLMEVDGLTFPRAVETAAQLAGIPMPGAREETAAEQETRRRRAADLDRKRQAAEARAARESEAKLSSASGIWRSSQPLPGSLAEVYLRSRGLTPGDEPNLRFHPGLPYPGSGKHPALIARVQGPDGKGCGVWRIFISKDGTSKADVENAKLGLGNVKGGAVRLGGEGPVIGAGEGVETCLAAREINRRHPIWATLSTSGMIGFVPPPIVRRVLIYPDGDSARWKNGEVKGPPGMHAATTLLDRLSSEGTEAAIVEPPVGGDYLDILNATKDA